VVSRLLVVVATTGRILLVLYGAVSFVNHALMVTGAIDAPESLGGSAARWHLIVWDPWWVLGGALFVLAAQNHRRVASQAA
jgi:hypothetical protein